MKKYLALSTIFILIVALGFIVIDPLEMRNDSGEGIMTSPSPTTMVSPQPSPTPRPSPVNGEVPDELPEGWSWSHDPSLEIQLAYPADWSLRPATSIMGESAVYSFDPAATPDTGGVPADELKIAVTYFGPADSRDAAINENQIISQEQVTVDARPAVQYQLSGQAGESITTLVETAQGVYLIAGYPRQSDLIDQYQVFLDNLQLHEPAPISLTEPQAGSVINLPLTASGSAPGSWLNEGQMPLRLQTYEGEVLVETVATTTENWMTTEPVNFSAELTGVQDLSQLDSIYGLLIFEKSNPSGLPENANQVMFPVRFQE